MPVVPYVVPARVETSYPEVRVSVLSLTQRGVGQPLVVSFQIDRYRVVNGVPEDAPAGTVSGNDQIGMAAVVADADLLQAIAVINERCVARAIAAGLLQASEE